MVQILPTALYSASQCRELDRATIDGYEIDGFTLMKRAGSAAFEYMRERWPKVSRLSILCGAGNNGGDGYIVAALAARAGIKTDVLCLGEPRSEDARAAARLALGEGVSPKPFEGVLSADAELFVDAIFGTGLKSAPRGASEACLDALNRSCVPVFSLDIPSGLDADTGNVPGVAARADATITFIGLKPGLFTGFGRNHCGAVVFDDLDVPEDVYRKVGSVATRIDDSDMPELMPRRLPADHKGSAGHIAIIGGDHGTSGAIRLAGDAALRAGSGLVTLVTRETHASVLNLGRPELMVTGIEERGVLRTILKGKDVAVIGPGLGQTSWSRLLWGEILDCDLPMIVDADGLNLLARDTVQRDTWILTPHPGEAARLLDCTTADVQSDRLAAVKAIQARYGGICVLKGSGTLIADDAGDTCLCDRGNAGMASGGMGDILSGVLGAMVGQGLTLRNSAIASVWLHAAAADRAAADTGPVGLIASDLMSWLRRLRNDPAQVRSEAP